MESNGFTLFWKTLGVKRSEFTEKEGKNECTKIMKFKTTYAAVVTILALTMASNICQRLLNKVWRSYANDLHEAPQVKGIYAIGRAWGNDVRYIYVGHSNDIRRRLQEHKYQHLAIDEFVKEQFRLNNGKHLRIKWVEEKKGECVEGDYLECIHKKLGYWPDYNKKHGNQCSCD